MAKDVDRAITSIKERKLQFILRWEAIRPPHALLRTESFETVGVGWTYLIIYDTNDSGALESGTGWKQGVGHALRASERARRLLMAEYTAVRMRECYGWRRWSSVADHVTLWIREPLHHWWPKSDPRSDNEQTSSIWWS